MGVNGQLLEMPSVSFEALYQILRRMLLLVIKNHLGKISFFSAAPPLRVSEMKSGQELPGFAFFDARLEFYFF